MIASKLLQQYSLISEQITPAELGVLLRELESLLHRGEAGAVVEFGCYSGTTSLFIRRLLAAYADEREFHAYDSFEGLPPKASQDQNAAGVDFAAGELAVSKRQFIKNFERAGLELPFIHKGWFNELSATEVPSPIAFAFLDGDFYESILTSLGLVWPKLSEHPVVLVHDYNRETLPGVASAVAYFMRRHSISPRLKVEANIAIITP